MTDESLSFSSELSPGAHVDEVSEPELKWRALTVVERGLTVLCGLILVGFTVATLLDVVTRILGSPVNWLQNFILGSFVWGVFLGGAVAQRRREHFRLAAIAEHYTGLRRQLFESLEQVVVLAVSLWMVYFGYFNVLSGRGNYLQPSQVPLSVVTAAIPVAGAFIAVFSVERLYHVWTNGAALGRSTGPSTSLTADGEAGPQ